MTADFFVFMGYFLSLPVDFQAEKRYRNFQLLELYSVM
ncbi:MAG: hypothetical protein UZ14_CFX002000077, partial [Chloroflexi bacterium OLB14]